MSREARRADFVRDFPEISGSFLIATFLFVVFHLYWTFDELHAIHTTASPFRRHDNLLYCISKLISLHPYDSFDDCEIHSAHLFGPSVDFYFLRKMMIKLIFSNSNPSALSLVLERTVYFCSAFSSLFLFSPHGPSPASDGCWWFSNIRLSLYLYNHYFMTRQFTVLLEKTGNDS